MTNPRANSCILRWDPAAIPDTLYSEAYSVGAQSAFTIAAKATVVGGAKQALLSLGTAAGIRLEVGITALSEPYVEGTAEVVLGGAIADGEHSFGWVFESDGNVICVVDAVVVGQVASTATSSFDRIVVGGRSSGGNAWAGSVEELYAYTLSDVFSVPGLLGSDAVVPPFILAPTVTLTAPVAATTHLVGAVLRIEFTCADATEVEVFGSVNGGAFASLGSDTSVSSGSGYVDYPIVAGDIGTLTFRADATGPGGTTQSATVAVTVTSIAALVAAYDGWAADWRSDTMTLLPGSTVTDLGFDSDPYWSKGVGWTVSGSAARFTPGTNGAIYKTVTTTQFRRYRFTAVRSAGIGLVYPYTLTQGQPIVYNGTFSVDTTAGGTRTGFYAFTTSSGIVIDSFTCTGLTCSTTTPGTRGAGFAALVVAEATDVTRPFRDQWGGNTGLRFDGDKAAVSTTAASHNHLHDGSGSTWWWCGKTMELPASPEPLFANCVDASGVGIQTIREIDDTVTLRVANGTGSYALETTSVAVLPKGRRFVLAGRWSSATNYEVWLDGVKIIDALVTGEVATDASAVVTYGALPGVATYPAKHIVHEFGTLCERVTDAQLAAIGRRLASDVGIQWPMPALLTPPTVSLGVPVVMEDTLTYDAFGVLFQKTDGTYVYYYREGTTHADDDGVIKMRTSSDDGATWSAATLVWELAGYDLRNLAGGRVSDGRWVLCMSHYIVATTEFTAWRYVSYDEGATWSAAEQIENGVVPQGPIIEWDGMFGVRVMPSLVAGAPSWAATIVAWDLTTDARNDRIIRDEVYSTNAGEGAYVHLGNNKLVGIERAYPDGDQMLRCYSEDGGMTWDVRRLDLPQYDPSPSTIVAWAHVSPWVELHSDGTVTWWFFRRYSLNPISYYGDLCSITCDPRVMIETPQDVGALVTPQWSVNSRNIGYPSRAGNLVAWFSGPYGGDTELYAAEVSVT